MLQASCLVERRSDRAASRFIRQSIRADPWCGPCASLFELHERVVHELAPDVPGPAWPRLACSNVVIHCVFFAVQREATFAGCAIARASQKEPAETVP
ncbi:hypothetical protein PWR63_11135 [Paraburkholderia sp. A2WS-5]|uniref:hypothetical protein n=1 Tax=unclassified Paraburkholderia TaxID=2615204 RepID=UPI003B791076